MPNDTENTIAPPVLTEVAGVASRPSDVGAKFVEKLAEGQDSVLETHGNGDLELYEQLASDDQVMPCFRQRRTNVVARELRVEPGGPSELDKLAADSLREQLAALSWDDITWKMLYGIICGYGVAECMWEQRGLQVWLAGVKVRKAKRFKFTTAGELRLLVDDKPTPVPERKFWTYVSGAEDDDTPMGRGLGHWLYWPVWFKRNGMRFWATFLEAFASGTVVATTPSSNEEERLKLLGLLESVTGGGRIVLPKGVAVEIVQAARDSGGDYEKFCDRMDRSITKIILMQTMTTEDGSSRAQGEVHERVGNFGAIADSSLVCESFMRGPARWLTEWNFPGAATPTVYRDFASGQDLTALATRDTALANMGWRPTAQRILETYGQGYEYSPPAAQPPAAFASFAAPPAGGHTAAEDLLESNGWQRVLGGEVGAVEDLIARSRSLEEVRDRLGELATQDPNRLTDALARIMFAARVAGNAEAEPDDGDERG